MRLRLVSVFALFALYACGSDDAGPDPFPTGTGGTTTSHPAAQNQDEEKQLGDLAVAAEEPIGDEDESSAVDPETGDRADEVDATGAIDNPIPDGPDEQGGFETLTPGADDLTTQSLRPLTGNEDVNAGETRANIGAKKWKCRQKTTRACVCEGSPVNCELPNDQPGRNRYIPTTKVDEINAKGGDKEKHVDEIGRWGINDGVSLYEGGGDTRGANVRGGCYDWDGNTTKQVDGNCVKLNFGQRKKMTVDGKERTYVYAFSITYDGDDGSGSASSWIPQSAVKSTNITAMPTVKDPAIGTLVSTSYVVKAASDWGQNQATFRSADLPSWAQAKVAKGGGSRKARDYLLRDGNVINLVFHTPGVGGAATDTLGVGNSTLGFQRVKSTAAQPTLVRVKVFDPNKTSMIFAYGQINGRYGWLPLEAIKQGEPKRGDDGKKDGGSTNTNPCAGFGDGVICSGTDSTKGVVCKAEAVVKDLPCDPGTFCIGGAADGPNGEKRVACQ